MIIDLSNCDVFVKKCTFLNLYKHLESSLHGFDKMQNVVLKSINKNRKREYKFFLFFNSNKNKKKANIDAKNLLSIAFL